MVGAETEVETAKLNFLQRPSWSVQKWALSVLWARLGSHFFDKWDDVFWRRLPWDLQKTRIFIDKCAVTQERACIYEGAAVRQQRSSSWQRFSVSETIIKFLKVYIICRLIWSVSEATAYNESLRAFNPVEQ